MAAQIDGNTKEKEKIDMSNYYGYGIDLSSDDFKFKPTAEDILWEKAEGINWVLDAYSGYCQYNELDPEGGFYREFIEDYENNMTLHTGIEAFLADVINELVDPVEKPFIYDDFVLCVPATIPKNEAEKASMLTQDQIRDILAEYVNPLIEKPVTVDWYKICED